MIRMLLISSTLLIGAGTAQAIINIPPYSSFVVDGAQPEDVAGFSVSGAGDVNGDGFADFIVGANFADPGGVFDAGTAYVLFGSENPSNVDLAGPWSGFRIDGLDPEDRLGGRVSGAGDVNADGLSDVIISVIGDDTLGNLAGAAYIVYGKTDENPVDPSVSGAGHVAIFGLNAEDSLSFEVSGAGDVNGDGFGDVIVGAPGFDVDGTSTAGAAYVIFGSDELGDSVDLTDPDWGFRVLGNEESGRLGQAVSGAGDVDGDGLDDLIVGSRESVTGDNREGRAYVVHGKAGFGDVRTDQFSGLGFVVNGNQSISNFARSVAGAGDVNADGRADLIIGDSGWDDGADFAVGRAYVIFGKLSTATVNVATLGSAGFTITGQNEGDFFGASVRPAGDFNRDGLADVLVGSEGADVDGLINNGAAYLVYGKADTDPVVTTSLGGDGLEIAGNTTEDEFGGSVSAIGDLNGDTRADFAVGADAASPQMRNLAGQTRVFLSSSLTQPLLATYRARAANGDALPVAVGRVGDGTRASIPESGLWVDYEDGASLSGFSSIETVEVFRTAGNFPENILTYHWRLATDRLSWSEVTLTFTYPENNMSDQGRRDLGVFYSPDGNPPFVGLEVIDTDPVKRTVTVRTALRGSAPAIGSFYLGSRLFFRDGFE